MTSNAFRDKSADSNNITSYNLMQSINNQSNSTTGNTSNNNTASLNFSGKGNTKIIQPNLNKQSPKQNLNKNTLVSLLDSLNLNKGTIWKDEGSQNFRKRIDKLNLKFYIETDKYLHNQNDMDKCQDQLFIILFKQITVYSEEVERLNLMLKDYQHCNTITTNKGDETRNDSSKDLNNLINEKCNENKQLKNEVESLKRQVKFFKEKLQLDLNNSSKNKSSNNNECNGERVHKKNISSDKLLVGLSKETFDLNANNKDLKLAYKPTLSMSNFNKKTHQKNSLSLIGSTNNAILNNNSNSNTNNLSNSNNINNHISSSVNTSNTSLIKSIQSQPNNQLIDKQQINTTLNNLDFNNFENQTSTTPSTSNTFNNSQSLTASKAIIKKRNHSDNDPNSTLQKTTVIKDGRERNDFMKSKLNFQEVVRLNNATSSSQKKPLVRNFYI